MKSLKKYLLIFAMFLSGANLLALNPSGVKLRLNLPKGEKVEMVSTVTTNSFRDKKMSEKAISVDLTMESYYTILDKSADGIYTVKYEITGISMTMDAMGQHMEYNSKSPDTTNPMTAIMAQQYSKLLNNPVTFKVNQLGETVEKPEAQEAMAIEKYLDQIFVTFPEKEISKGDSWEKEQKSPTPGAEGSMHIVYTITDISGNEVTTKVHSEPKDLKINGTPMKPEDMQQSGTLNFDRKTGKLLKSDFKQVLTTNNPQLGEIFTVMSIKQTVK